MSCTDGRYPLHASFSSAKIELDEVLCDRDHWLFVQMPGQGYAAIWSSAPAWWLQQSVNGLYAGYELRQSGPICGWVMVTVRRCIARRDERILPHFKYADRAQPVLCGNADEAV